MGGRPPLPASMKILSGRADGKDSAGRDIAKPVHFDAPLGDAPDWFTGEALSEWERILDVTPKGMLRGSDRVALIAYCLAWQRFCEVHNEPVVPAEDTSKRPPIYGEREKASSDLLRWSRELGLTPMSSQRIAAPSEDPDPEEDPF